MILSMKTLKRTIIGLASLAVLFTACNDFEEINKDPNAVDESAIKVSYLLNKSIMGAQQNPHIAERVFVYQWKSAARFERRSGLATGANYNDYNTDYFGVDYGVVMNYIASFPGQDAMKPENKGLVILNGSVR